MPNGDASSRKPRGYRKNVKRSIDSQSKLSETVEEFDVESGQLVKRTIRTLKDHSRTTEDESVAPDYPLPETDPRVSGEVPTWISAAPATLKISIFPDREPGDPDLENFWGDYLIPRVPRSAARAEWEFEFEPLEGLSRLRARLMLDETGQHVLSAWFEGTRTGPGWKGCVDPTLSSVVVLDRDESRAGELDAGRWPRTILVVAIRPAISGPAGGSQSLRERHAIPALPTAAEMAAMRAFVGSGSSGSGGSGSGGNGGGGGGNGGQCPDRPTCTDHENGLVQSGWTHWFIPQNVITNQGDNHSWHYDLTTGIVTTPTTTMENEWNAPVSEHATTIRSYPDGFVLEIEYRFDPNQLPIFPKNGRSGNKHRPTFLGNSGIGIYHWTGNSSGKYLYEVQVTDNAGMTGGQRYFKHENRFVRLNYGPDWTMRGSLKKIDPKTLLNDEASVYNPRLISNFLSQINDGGADSLCAIVAGLPVSYFKDDYYEDPVNPENIFPRPNVAVSSSLPLGPNNPNPLPIGGEEDPLRGCPRRGCHA